MTDYEAEAVLDGLLGPICINDVVEHKSTGRRGRIVQFSQNSKPQNGAALVRWMGGRNNYRTTYVRLYRLRRVVD